MELWSVVNGKKLRNGYTTGSCAAGATGAALQALLSGKEQETVRVDTPKGVSLFLEVADCIFYKDGVSCSVIKDAGDDPDSTDGIKIWSRVERISSGIIVDGGDGVGRVTRPGMNQNIGEAAINPVPMKMIKDTVAAISKAFGCVDGFKVLISAENGLEIAKKTFNSRLGIIGGISILGTSGIVEPMSEKALIDTIRLEINAKAAANSECLLICLGNYGQNFAYSNYGIDMEVGIKCSNFIGEALDYAAYKGFKKILVVGHSGKLVKLAGGIMNTHSKTADCRQEIFAAHAALAGADKSLIFKIMNAVTTDEIDDMIVEAGIKDRIWESLIEKIAFHAAHRLKGAAVCEFIVFTNKSGFIKSTRGVEEFINIVKNMEK